MYFRYLHSQDSDDTNNFQFEKEVSDYKKNNAVLKAVSIVYIGAVVVCGIVKMKKKTKNIIAIVLTLIIGMGAFFYIYVSDYYRADISAEEALKYHDDGVEIKYEENTIWFVPENIKAGFVFYPGGKVEYSAYAPLLRECAKQGILSAVTRMPFNLAVFNPDAAEGLTSKYPDVDRWYIGGHSLGGAMAADYASKHDEEFKGLILLASYSTKDLRNKELKVLSIYGSNDEVLNIESYADNLINLPLDTTETILEGGCHSQFGSYGLQKGDGICAISSDEQLKLTVKAISEFTDD